MALEICGDQIVEKVKQRSFLLLERHFDHSRRSYMLIYFQVREFCGPMDPEIARHIRPQTIRAMFGVDKISNAVHCTDLPEDGVLEVCRSP